MATFGVFTQPRIRVIISHVKGEVKTMKKFVTSFVVTVAAVILLVIPITSHAATANSRAGIVDLSSGSLNVRSGSSTSSPVLTTISAGTLVTLESKSGSWWQVEYSDGRYGYCHASYITEFSSSPAAVALNYGTLNLRSGPATSYQRIGALSNGEIVLVLSESNGWSRILYNGSKLAYVSSKYLSNSVSSVTARYFPVSLSVPNYKQTDSRWANIKIGNYGQTMSKIGCATTAIAMMESYRTGTTIYPSAMVKKLSYTASGSVYWPSHYTAITNSSGYLNAIYSQLKSGKAVMLGAKNSYGGQHWVVVTGFSGGSSLTTSGFTINDPGSSTRTTLAQFFSDYPYFYKFFIY